MKLITALLLIVGIAALGVATYWDRFVKEDFRYTGTVEATFVDLPSRVSSTISTMTVQEGDSVSKGQMLVELGCEDLKLDASIAERDFKRNDRLLRAGSAPYELYDKSRTRRDLTALNVEWCRIASPINGVVLARVKEPGEWAAPGVSLLTLADLDDLYAYAYVPQSVLYRLKPGDAVTARLPEAGDLARRGRIAFIRPEAEFTPRNVQTRKERTRLVYAVKIHLDNQDRILKPGMPIEIDLPH
ncbi:MAG: efflux RND transporter periplasmic adaptor subunit [Elusimicrobia bacterium]|nr:efflux RND transporter periplasmic adaptor subunit [Elusimicrobiota bacterium]